MECGFFERRFARYSDEKRKVMAMALNGRYYCPYCRTIHILEVEGNGQTQEH